MDEVEAIARLKAGDIEGLRTLVVLYQAEAVQAAGLVTNDAALAEDVAQSAFLRIFEKIKSFDSSRPFRPWFMRVVVNDAIKAAVRQKRLAPLSEDEEDGYWGTVQGLEAAFRQPEEEAERSELVESLRKALDLLTPSQRAAIVMHYFLGLDSAEAAGQLDCKPGTVRWHLSAARERLRTLLDSFK